MMRNKGAKTVVIVVLLAVAVGVAYFIMGNKKGSKDSLIENKTPNFVKEGELMFINSLGNDTLAIIDIEVADNDQKTAQGLMYRTSMPKNAGMLFFMRAEETQGFWMKNTYIPLDMLFVNSKKEIVTIHRNTTPLKESSYFSTEPALYVVEVNAGFTSNNNINEGDKIEFTLNR